MCVFCALCSYCPISFLFHFAEQKVSAVSTRWHRCKTQLIWERSEAVGVIRSSGATLRGRNTAPPNTGSSFKHSCQQTDIKLKCPWARQWTSNDSRVLLCGWHHLHFSRCICPKSLILIHTYVHTPMATRGIELAIFGQQDAHSTPEPQLLKHKLYLYHSFPIEPKPHFNNSNLMIWQWNKQWNDFTAGLQNMLHHTAT